MQIKRLFATIWTLAICFLSFFAGFLVLGVIGAMTYGFIYPGVDQVPEPWSTRIVFLSFIGGIVLAIVVWIKRRRRRNNQATVTSTKRTEVAPFFKAPTMTVLDVHPRAPRAQCSDLIKEDRDTELRRIDFMEGHEFEYWCAGLLRSIGYTDVSVTKGSGDQGVDVLAQKDGIRYAIQCKCYSNDLGNSPVQEVHTGKTLYHCQVGAVMTNRHFTKGAKEAAEATGVLLWDRAWIAAQIQRRSTSAISSPVSANRPASDLLESIIEDFLVSGQVNVSRIQQQFGLDYHYATFIMQALEESDFVTPGDRNTPREMKISAAQWSALKTAREQKETASSLLP